MSHIPPYMRLRLELGLTANTDVLLWRTRQLLESTDGSVNTMKPPRSPISSDIRKRGGKSSNLASVHSSRSGGEASTRSRADGNAEFEEEPLASDEEAEESTSRADGRGWQVHRDQESSMSAFEARTNTSDAPSNSKGSAAVTDDGRNLNKVSRKALELILSGALDEVMERLESS